MKTRISFLLVLVILVSYPYATGGTNVGSGDGSTKGTNVGSGGGSTQGTNDESGDGSTQGTNVGSGDGSTKGTNVGSGGGSTQGTNDESGDGSTQGTNILGKCILQWISNTGIQEINGTFILQFRCRHSRFTACNSIFYNCSECICNSIYTNYYQNNYHFIPGFFQNLLVGAASIKKCYEQEMCSFEDTGSCQPANVRCTGKQSGPPNIGFGVFSENITAAPETQQNLWEGYSLSMTCFVRGGIPKPTLNWEANNVSDMEIGNTLLYKRQNLLYQTIKVNLTSAHNEATYTCIVTQNDIITQNQVKLHVDYAPIISIASNQTVQEFTDVTIRCTVQSNPSSNTTLRKPNGDEITTPDPEPDDDSLYIRTYIFNIGTVSLPDWGNYTCVAVNAPGGKKTERSKVTTLFVEYAPIIELKARNTSTDIILECIVTSFPKAEITWSNDIGVTVPHEELISPPVAGHAVNITAFLRFPNATAAHEGQYTCTAENVVDKTTAVTTLYGETLPTTCPAIIRKKRPCRCNKRRTNLRPQLNITVEVLHEKMAETKRQLTKDRKMLSKYLSTKMSAPDHRPSSVFMGFIGIVIIIITVAFIISGDIVCLFNRLKMRYIQDKTLEMEGHQSDPSNTANGDNTTDDEKPSTSNAYMNALRPDKTTSSCNCNDNDITIQDITLSDTTVKQPVENRALSLGTVKETTLTCVENVKQANENKPVLTGTDKEIISQLSDINQVFDPAVTSGRNTVELKDATSHIEENREATSERKTKSAQQQTKQTAPTFRLKSKVAADTTLERQRKPGKINPLTSVRKHLRDPKGNSSKSTCLVIRNNNGKTSKRMA